MKTQMGEYVVGAYLKLILGCDVVDYNVRPPGGGLQGLAEFDVVGLKFGGKEAFVCEVTTHLDGLKYGNNQETIERIQRKYERQQQYARTCLTSFENVHFMFWSPVVPRGYLTRELSKLDGLDIIINEEYKARVGKLRELARETTRDVGNPFFRALQILEHLRDEQAKSLT